MQTKNSKWWLLLGLSLMAFIINVDYTAVNLALIPISTALSADLNTVQWLLSAYVLAWAAIIIPAGKMADRFGKRSVCLIGISMFVLATVLAGMSHSIKLLILSRVLQGISGAIYTPAIYALIYENFPEKQRGMAIGLLSVGIGLGAALGPTIGGVLLQLLGWRSIFFICIPFGIVAFGLIQYYAENKLPLEPQVNAMPKLGAVLLSVGLISLIYLLNQWPLWANHSVRYLGLAVLVIVLFAFFIHQERKHALIPVNLLNNKSFLIICTAFGIEQYGFATIVVITGLYLQKVHHYSSYWAGIIYLSLTVLFGVTAMVGGKWADRIGIKKPAILGLFIMTIGAFAFTQLSPQSSLLFITFILAALGVGMGFAFSALNTGIVKVVANEEVSIGSSVFLLCALLGNALGVTFATMLYEKTSQHLLITWLSDRFGNLSMLQMQQVAEHIGDIGQQSVGLSAFDPVMLERIHQVMPHFLNQGTHNAMWLLAILCLIASLIMWRLFERRTVYTTRQ